MDIDLIFVIGCVVLLFSIPAIVSAFSDGRAPRYGTMTLLISTMMIYYATGERPGAYTFETVPDVIMRVIGRYLN
ncbi:MAG: hypothetical protein ABF248_00505 [Yoonia sp.]